VGFGTGKRFGGRTPVTRGAAEAEATADADATAEVDAAALAVVSTGALV
jgi:hypothetical protein